MHKLEQSATADPNKVLEEIAKQQRNYHSEWEADWSRQVVELARNSGGVEENELRFGRVDSDSSSYHRA